MLTKEDLKVKTLGEPRFHSSLNLSSSPADGLPNYVPDNQRIPFDVVIREGEDSPLNLELSFERGGPREKLFFQPKKIYAAIVTCGGLCPGLNNVIQSVFLQLHFGYGVEKVLGVRFGFAGFDPKNNLEPVEMTPDFVEDIGNEGGCVLGSSRGNVPADIIVETLEQWKVDMLFVIGGDGTLKGAHAVAEEVEKRGLKISVIGIPKTIDNDINYVYKTFGFDTAVKEAARTLHCAHNEARGAENGIGLVKVMGRDSGFIACHATLASMVVNLALIPELKFRMEGPGSVLELLMERIVRRGHAVVCLAEGAGLEHCPGEMEYDASGNIKYSSMSKDVGIYMRDKIKSYFKEHNVPVNVKYIDPSYIIRSVPADSADTLFCNDLGRTAVHAAMAGKTDMVVGRWYNMLTHVPLQTVTRGKNTVQTDSKLWLSVVEATGQPLRFEVDE